MAIAVPKNTAIASGLITKNIPNASNDMPCTSPNDTNTSSLDILKYVISLNTPHTHNAIPTALHMIICDTSGNIVRKRPNTNNAIAVFFGTAIAIIIIIDGILKLQYAIEFYHMEAQRWWIEAIVAALMVVMGVVALFNPFGSSTVLMMFVGIVLMVEGLSDLISIIRISSFIKNLRG